MRDIFNARAEFRALAPLRDAPHPGIDELYLNKRYRCILTNIEERTLLDLLATRRRRGDQLPDEAERPAEGRDRQHGHVEPLPGSGQGCAARPVSWSISSMWCAWPTMP